MSLETATFLGSLVITNPVGASDDRSTADDHLRLIKACLRRTFKNVDAEVSASAGALNASLDFVLYGLRNNVADSLSATLDFITPPVGRAPGATTKYTMFPILGGAVSSAGAATKLPSGWISAKNSTGNYTITHNLGRTLGTDNMMVVCSCYEQATRTVGATSTGATSSTFDVNTQNSTTGAAADANFAFIVAIW